MALPFYFCSCPFIVSSLPCLALPGGGGGRRARLLSLPRFCRNSGTSGACLAGRGVDLRRQCPSPREVQEQPFWPAAAVPAFEVSDLRNQRPGRHAPPGAAAAIPVLADEKLPNHDRVCVQAQPLQPDRTA